MAKKIAKTEREWWDLIREDRNKYNYDAHPEDRMDLLEYVGEMTRYDNIYGYKVEVDDYSQSGYELTKSPNYYTTLIYIAFVSHLTHHIYINPISKPGSFRYTSLPHHYNWRFTKDQNTSSFL